MVMRINEGCITCGACIQVCPNQAIVEGKEIYKILPEKCTECVGFYPESQCKSVCPVDCIDKDPNYNETHEELIEKGKR